MIALKLRFDDQRLPELAARYQYADDAEIEKEVGPRARERGYFTRPELLSLCHWKSPRSQSSVARNTDGLIEDATRIALSTPHERLRIGVLTLLHGVSWPTASVVLHFAHREPYPILDYRALWSAGVEERRSLYTFDFWWEYVQFCRALASKCHVTMRTLDRALWQYSKENQQ